MNDQIKPSQPDLLEEIKGLNNILSVAQVVVSSLELDEVLQNILLSAMAIMDTPAGSIALYNEETSYIEMRTYVGLSEQFTARKSWKVKRGGLTWEILERGELFVVEDTEKAGFFNNPLALEEGIRSLIAAPLKIQNKVVGILYVDDFNPRKFPEKLLQKLSILASFATMSIDNARLHQQTQLLASTDGLTGLYNHRQFKMMFAEEVSRAERYSKPLSIIMFDVDDFKQFNDTYGHPNGDIVLKGVADLLRDLLRGCDTIYRYGGEEFVALLPETTHEDALRVAERIRIFVETESPLFLTGITRTHGVSVSVGVASLPQDGRDTKTLLKTVDDLMYKAKQDGKNKVYYSGGSI